MYIFFLLIYEYLIHFYLMNFSNFHSPYSCSPLSSIEAFHSTCTPSYFHIFSLCWSIDFIYGAFSHYWWGLFTGAWATHHELQHSRKRQILPNYHWLQKAPQWGMGSYRPFLSCNEMIKSSVLWRACAENSSGSKFITKMSKSCQEQAMC